MNNLFILLIIILIGFVGYFIVQKVAPIETVTTEEATSTTEEVATSTVPEEQTEATTTVKVFFGNSKLNTEADCNKVFPTERVIVQTEGIARAALEELLKGPTAEEEKEEFFSNINKGVKIQSLTIEEGTAKVDFDEQLEFQVGGSCRVTAIRAEITETLKQFDTVDNVIISIDGRTEDILQP
ncbi:MAG: GerMN domain-containing protein [Candidatus Pacebacteria bacterium]|nr:GerMN domain-containing protein [Candidatus Paceibacterota bacterium]